MVLSTADGSSAETERLRIDSTGIDVTGGIAVTGGDNSQLHLKGNDTNPTAILLDYNSGGATNRTRIYNNAGDLTFLTNNGDERARITSTGNVGIGTSSPNAKLDVAGASGISVNNNYAHMGSTVSGAMAIFGHNIKTDSSSANVVTSANTGYHSSMMKMYYNEGITFHSISTTATAGDTFYAPGATNELVRIQNGGGISFNGDTASANALDDYEEGTWTPTIVGGGAATLNNVSSTYTKIGNRVMITCYINIYPNSDSNDFKLGGLPYTNKSNSWGASPVNTTGNNHPNVCVRAQGHTGTILDFKNHETDSAFNFNDWGNGAHLVFQLQYPIA
jgi:hypothetical protein